MPRNNLSPIYISYLAATWPPLGHCRVGSFSNPILITAFDTYLTNRSSCNEVRSQSLANDL